MKSASHSPRPIDIPQEIAAKRDAPNQSERFDHMVRTLVAVPKAEIDRRDAKWRRAQARKRAKKGGTDEVVIVVVLIFGILFYVSSLVERAIHYVSHPGRVALGSPPVARSTSQIPEVRIINDPAPPPTKREETPSASSPAPSGQSQAQSSELIARTAEPLVAPDNPHCTDRKRLRSRVLGMDDDNPENIKVTFYNNSPAQETMKFWWIDPQGQEKYVQTLAYGQWYTQPTHADEVWLATDATGGSCLAVITTRKGVHPILSMPVQ